MRNRVISAWQGGQSMNGIVDGADKMPLWVRLGLLGVSSRRPYLVGCAIGFGIAVLMTILIGVASYSMGVRAGNLALVIVFIVLTVWQWLTLRWTDKHDAWPN